MAEITKEDTTLQSGVQKPDSLMELSDEERQRHARFKALRDTQEREANRRLQWTDVALVLGAVFTIRTLLKKLQLPAFRVLWNGAILLLAYGLYQGRAPKKILETSEGDFPVWPIFGQILQIRNAIRKGLVGNQLERSKLRGYKTSELVLFGPIRDFGIMDPKDREYILRSNWRNFTKNVDGSVGFQEILAPVMGRGIFTVDPRTEKDGDDEWAEHRKVASHLFAANALRFKMELSFVKHANRLVDLLKHHAVGSVIDLQDCMQAFTFETICEIAFGVEPGALESSIVQKKKIDFLVRFDRAQNLCLNRLVVPTMVWKLLRYLNIGYEAQLSEDSRELRAYVQNIIAARKRELANNADDQSEDKHGDMLSLYMKTAKDARKPYLAEDGYLQDVVLNFMVAGRDTTSSTLTQLFRMLSKHPDVADKMLEEMKRVLKDAPHVSWDHIKDLAYSGAVFNEILRLHPPVPGDFRLCNETCQLPSGLVVPRGSRVSIQVAAIGRDANIWDRPEEFLPERWLDTSDPRHIATKRIPEYILPCFWGGPRICLGKDAARLEVLSTVYKVLSSGLRFSLLPNQSDKMGIGPVQFYENGVRMKVEYIK